MKKTPAGQSPPGGASLSPAPDQRIPLRELDPGDGVVGHWQGVAGGAARRPAHAEAQPNLLFERYRPLLEASGDRRRFMKMVMASMGAAGLGPGLAGCAKEPAGEIIPYVDQPEGVLPGTPRHYSSVLTRDGYGYGVVVESHQGRPTKVEGNARHPASLGASDVFMQAELLNLYDPDRSRSILEDGRIRGLGELQQVLAGQREQWARDGGAGLRILTPRLGSPSLAQRLRGLLENYPEARWHQWQPMTGDMALRGARLAFGRDLEVRYEPARADRIVQLDGDLLSELPGSLRYSREFARRREPGADMSRVYAVESRPGLLGAAADHRLTLSAPRVEQAAHYLLAVVAGGQDVGAGRWPDLGSEDLRWLDACAADLRAHRGRGLVIAGADQAPAVHAIAHWLNGELGNAGATLVYQEPVAARSEPLVASMEALCRAMRAGQVSDLLMLDGNPVYDAPADLGFADALEQVPFSLHLGEHVDETAVASRWHLPLAHALESWGDARAFDGSAALRQPLIAPLYNGLSPHSLLAFLNGDTWRGDYDCVRDYWRQRLGGEDFEAYWRRLLVEGVLADSAAPSLSPSLRPELLDELPAPAAAAEPVLQFTPDARLWDGRYANNAWLQELPQPLNKLIWGNALLLAPALARRLGVENGDVIRLDARGRGLRAPAWIMPGHADGAVSLSLGHGREIAAQEAASSISHGIGVNAYPMRDTDTLSYLPQVALRKTGERVDMARTQHYETMDGRHPVRHATLSDYRRDPNFLRREEAAHDPAVSLYPEPDPAPFDAPGGYEWGMAIDLNACIGCGACTLACQAENNIPVVGREQALAGRVMHWLRIDRYYSEAAEEAELQTWFQPMLCQHCENAPCEYVCPVGATVHDSEGLNVMVYNRCIGTRDCSQNCPYKVRRFNFLEYNYDTPHGAVMAPARNPDVSVRSRGVMEKCTFCLQRISGARRQAKKEGREIRDGELQTACQQACPTRAITFGNLNDAGSAVSRAKQDALDYHVLAELNTRPRTSYRARLRNVNDELAAARAGNTEEG